SSVSLSRARLSGQTRPVSSRCASAIAERIDVVGLQTFLREWREFLRPLGPQFPFQTPEWLLTWRSHWAAASCTCWYSGAMRKLSVWCLASCTNGEAPAQVFATVRTETPNSGHRTTRTRRTANPRPEHTS